MYLNDAIIKTNILHIVSLKFQCLFESELERMAFYHRAVFIFHSSMTQGDLTRATFQWYHSFVLWRSFLRAMTIFFFKRFYSIKWTKMPFREESKRLASKMLWNVIAEITRDIKKHPSICNLPKFSVLWIWHTTAVGMFSCPSEETQGNKVTGESQGIDLSLQHLKHFQRKKLNQLLLCSCQCEFWH